MSEHTVTVAWKRETAEFTFEAYNRDHDWTFDGGITVRASAPPRLSGQRPVRRSRGGVRRQPLQLPDADLPGPRRQGAIRGGQLPGSGGRGPGAGPVRELGHDEGDPAPRGPLRRREDAWRRRTAAASRARPSR